MDATILIALAVVAVLVAPAVYAALRLRQIERVRLFEVVQGQNLPAPDAQSEASVRAGAYALRRCVNCRAQATCDRAIAQKDWSALAKVCPNEDYLQALRAG